MSSAAPTLPTARMEAFSDGVIAVIITIMVLELHVPHVDGLAALREVAPRLAIYLLSFTMTGIYWLNHHELVRHVERVHYNALVANLFWLFILSLLPFSTDYVGEKHFSSFAVVQYEVVLLGTGLAFGLLRVVLLRAKKQVSSLEPRDTVEGVKHLISLAIYIVAILAASRHPLVSLVLSALVTLVWFAPSFGTGRAMHKPHRREGVSQP